MRSHRKRAAVGLGCLLALATTACSEQGEAARPAPPASAAPSASSPAESESGTSSTTSYAPYVDAKDASATDSAGSPTTYNLAFVLAGGSGCTPRWNGTDALGDAAVKSRIAKLKEDGAEVRVSFGGASGKELAAACDSASELAAAYGKALDAAGATRADFDIEGDELADSASIDVRSKAIALLQKERTDLEVSFTLPVMPSGLGKDSLALLASANDNGVQVATVNLMTMNYGSSFDGDMGGYALAAAKASHTQLKKVFGTSDAAAWRGMALTSMIGVNDVDGETFTLADATEVRAFAEDKGIGWVSMWSAARDRGCADGAKTDKAATDCSGVKQSSGAFAEAFSG
ncbi:MULTISPECIES: chitinase [Streptomyces]|uniref:Chitinase n=1 Tax=Streptomyces koelreuteriae TaxID=2838015 RepID=A0ABX8FRG6_9ACTN|nr:MULTISPECIES: chitinase [Streptomyces]QWB23770.1 chitinase [Streptomyces koelreuteriae]UUA06746.1 chitinase [Streptomyces koelreuteriae]UUA14375.1 chitinase [Streptomyces sp. CRCS-T-1]